jgi:GDP-L-fucose synthase
MAALSEQPAALKANDAVPKVFGVHGQRVFVPGHRGLVGSAIVRRLTQAGCDVVTAGREQVDLLRQADTEHFLLSTRPDVVIIAAGKVGGIHANSTLPAGFIYENLMIAGNLIHGAFRADVRKLLFLGSSCIYPKLARQPMVEEALLTTQVHQ